MKLSDVYKEFILFKGAKGPRSRKTAARYEITLRNFCLAVHDPDIESLTIHHVMWYMSELERLGWKPAGRNLIALAIRKLIEFANLRGFRTFNEQLIELPEKQFSIPRVTNKETFTKLLESIPNDRRPYHLRNRALLSLLWDTGARSGELCSLNVNDLDFNKQMAYVRSEKSRGRRPIRQLFWTERTSQYIKDWINCASRLKEKFNFKDPDALFVSIAKSPQYDTRGQRMTNMTVAEIMRTLSNKLGIPTVNAHSIRHSMGRDTIEVAKSNSAVSNILGHSSLDSSYIYTMLFGDELKNQWHKVMKKRRI